MQISAPAALVAAAVALSIGWVASGGVYRIEPAGEAGVAWRVNVWTGDATLCRWWHECGEDPDDARRRIAAERAARN